MKVLTSEDMFYFSLVESLSKLVNYAGRIDVVYHVIFKYYN
jgi:hypothetical protein